MSSHGPSFRPRESRHESKPPEEPPHYGRNAVISLIATAILIPQWKRGPFYKIGGVLAAVYSIKSLGDYLNQDRRTDPKDDRFDYAGWINTVWTIVSSIMKESDDRGSSRGGSDSSASPRTYSRQKRRGSNGDLQFEPDGKKTSPASSFDAGGRVGKGSRPTHPSRVAAYGGMEQVADSNEEEYLSDSSQSGDSSDDGKGRVGKRSGWQQRGSNRREDGDSGFSSSHVRSSRGVYGGRAAGHSRGGSRVDDFGSDFLGAPSHPGRGGHRGVSRTSATATRYDARYRSGRGSPPPSKYDGSGFGDDFM